MRCLRTNPLEILDNTYLIRKQVLGLVQHHPVKSRNSVEIIPAFDSQTDGQTNLLYGD